MVFELSRAVLDKQAVRGVPKFYRKIWYDFNNAKKIACLITPDKNTSNFGKHQFIYSMALHLV